MLDNSEEIKGQETLLAALRVHLVSGVGPRISTYLREYFGTTERILNATYDELRQVSGVGDKVAAGIRAARLSSAAQDELARCRELGIHLALFGAEEYPPWLSEIPDPPAILYQRGTIEPRDRLAVAIVGSRRCTIYGERQAERFAGELARAGVTVVSGLARGVDAAAHRGALAAGGRTIAVLATGVVEIYPPEHAELAEEIVRSGALVSEAPLEQAAVPGVFPQRNRIISGLSLGVLLVEAARKSGALHTARHAIEQNREVFAIPGRLDSLASEGCHDLIRDGATLVRDAEDILKTLGPLPKPVAATDKVTVHEPRELLLNDQEKMILNLITPDPQSIDALLAQVSLETSRVLQTITVLEMQRLIRRVPGGQLCRAT